MNRSELEIFPAYAPDPDLWTVPLEAIKGSDAWRGKLIPPPDRGPQRIEPDAPDWRVRYQAYLLSDTWARKRRLMLKWAKGKCEECGDRFALEVHHRTYAHLGNEPRKDLAVLCPPCHRKADVMREARVAADRWDRRLDGWATKKYGEDWDRCYDWEEIEEEFDAWLERNEGR